MKRHRWRSQRPPLSVYRSTAGHPGIIVGCDRLDMYDQPRYKPLAESDFFADGLSRSPRVEGTIARGELHDDEPLYTGKEAGILVSQIPQSVYRLRCTTNVPRQFNQPLDQTQPAELRRALLMRGRERFDIHCSVCHGRTGDGDGMIVRRGFRKPPSLHIERLRECSGGLLFRCRHQWLRRDAQLRQPD